MSSRTEDKALMEIVLKGDAIALGALQRRIAGALVRRAKQLGKYGLEIEDVSQDVMMKVIKHAGSWDPDRASLDTWLYRIAENHCITISRQQRTLKRGGGRQAVSLDFAEPAGESALLSSELKIDSEVWRIEFNSLVTPEQQALLYLSTIRGLTDEQIATFTRVPLGTVKSRRRALEKSLKRLKTRLNHEPDKRTREHG